MTSKLQKWWIVLAALALLAGCGDDDETPRDQLTGVWELVEFVDDGVTGACDGTAEFRADGAFIVDGTVTFPDEPTDPLDVAGTWSMDGEQVVLTAGQTTGAWDVAFGNDAVTLTEDDDDSPNVMRLCCREP